MRVVNKCVDAAKSGTLTDNPMAGSSREVLQARHPKIAVRLPQLAPANKMPSEVVEYQPNRFDPAASAAAALVAVVYLQHLAAGNGGLNPPPALSAKRLLRASEWNGRPAWPLGSPAAARHWLLPTAGVWAASGVLLPLCRAAVAVGLCSGELVGVCVAGGVVAALAAEYKRGNLPPAWGTSCGPLRAARRLGKWAVAAALSALPRAGRT
nr:hypothetical protein [Tanacetum cinerariifolium]